MQKVTYFYLTHCPYCIHANTAIEELVAENPAYTGIEISRIEESQQKKFADSFDYYYVPTMYVGDEKNYEADPSQGYEDIKRDVKRVFDRAIS